MAVVLTDINVINHLYDVATGGRSKSARTRAERKLEAILDKEIHRANQRMRELEKQGLDYGPAYDTAAEYLETHGRKRFSKAKGRPIAEKYEEALRARQFLAAPTSTVKGQRAAIKKRNETFRERFPELTKDKSDEELEDFQRFLGTPGVDDYLKYFYDSGEEVEALGELFDDMASEDGNVDKLKELFSEYDAFLKWREENPGAPTSEHEGLTFGELRERLDKLYESAAKRRR